MVGVVLTGVVWLPCQYINHGIYHCVITIITASITHGRDIDTARQHETDHYTEPALTYTVSARVRGQHQTPDQRAISQMSEYNVLRVTVAGAGLCPARGTH